MNDFQWVDLDERKPSDGQRCLIWDDEEWQSSFAVWSDSTQSWEEFAGDYSRKVYARFWMEPPGDPFYQRELKGGKA